MRAADALIEAVAHRGVDTVFGVPGGAALPLYDALAASPIRHVLTRHEAAAGHAAEGWARVTGRPGVALATSGPGAVNLLTAVADAWMDSVPVVFICGQVATHLTGTMAFQETDVAGMAIPVVKHSSTARPGEDLGAVFDAAFELASGGRPGPVLLEIPVDVAKAPAAGRRRPPVGPARPARPRAKTVLAAAELIERSARPVVLAGGGVVAAGAHDQLVAFTRAADIPYVTTLHGLECGGGHGWLGMPGVYGTRVGNWALHQADCILAVGARFDDRVTGNLDGFASRARVIHIDSDASELGKLVEPEIAICADARMTLDALVAMFGGPPDRSHWWESIDAQLVLDPVAPPAAHEGEAALDELNAMLDRDAVITTDVGLHQMWSAHRLSMSGGRRWITSGGAGTMGFGLPAAIGAQAAGAERQVVCVTGDGSLLMHMQELVTAATEQLAVKVLLLDNQSLGMVRAQQDRFYSGAFAADLGARPDWAALARACGVSVADSIEELLSEPGPAFHHVLIPGDAECLPLVAPGTSTATMIGRARAA
jgi:acetolactate synthase-1/2/3 large subunit